MEDNANDDQIFTMNRWQFILLPKPVNLNRIYNKMIRVVS